MRKNYYVELYYYKDNMKELGFKEEPDLDNYKSETKMTKIISNSWDEAKNKLLLEFPNIAYIYVHETRNIDI
jgi:hypothetical protein